MGCVREGHRVWGQQVGNFSECVDPLTILEVLQDLMKVNCLEGGLGLAGPQVQLKDTLVKHIFLVPHSSFHFLVSGNTWPETCLCSTCTPWKVLDLCVTRLTTRLTTESDQWSDLMPGLGVWCGKLSEVYETKLTTLNCTAPMVNAWNQQGSLTLKHTLA